MQHDPKTYSTLTPLRIYLMRNHVVPWTSPPLIVGVKVDETGEQYYMEARDAEDVWIARRYVLEHFTKAIVLLELRNGYPAFNILDFNPTEYDR